MNNVALKNLTPHQIHLFNGADELVLVLDPEEVPARVSTEDQWLCSFEGPEGTTIPLYRTEFGKVVGLPDREAGILLVVSGLVQAACPDRDDLVVPHDLVRDNNGRILGCRGFRR